MRIMYRNYWDDYALAESEEDATYPVENTQDIRLVKVYHSATVGTIVKLDLDAGTGEAITCDCCAIINHNLSGSSETSIQACDSYLSDNDFETGSVNSVITHRSGPMVVFFESGSHRWWRFKIEDTVASNSDGYVKIGRLFLGTYIQVDPSSLVEFPVKHVRNDQVMFSKSNQLYADEGVGWKELHYKFPRSTNSMKGSVETMFGSCGKFKPILVMNYDTTFTIIDPLYCSVTEDITFKHMKNDKWEYDLVLRECN